jgi:hypothetical protein
MVILGTNPTPSSIFCNFVASAAIKTPPPIHPREIYVKSEKSKLIASHAIAAGVLSRHPVTNVDDQALAKARPVTFAVIFAVTKTA